MDLNIKRSAAINSTRMELMNIRNDFMVRLVKETLERLANEVSQPENLKYQSVMRDLIVQGCVKLLEPVVLLKVRAVDVDMVRGLLPAAKAEYEDLMAREAEPGKYKTDFEVIETEFIEPDSEGGKCGGVVLMNKEKTITCSNTLDNRMHLCYEESLPTIRKHLFPETKKA